MPKLPPPERYACPKCGGDSIFESRQSIVSLNQPAAWGIEVVYCGTCGHLGKKRPDFKVTEAVS